MSQHEFIEQHSVNHYPTADDFKFQFPEPHWCEIREGRGYPSELRKMLLTDVDAFDHQLKGFFKANCANVFDFIKSAFTLYRHLDAYLRHFICGSDDGPKVLEGILGDLCDVDDATDEHIGYVNFDGDRVDPDARDTRDVLRALHDLLS